jgi:peptidoglycan/LPS O-acetylase OafA/YrhL
VSVDTEPTDAVGHQTVGDTPVRDRADGTTAGRTRTDRERASRDKVSGKKGRNRADRDRVDRDRAELDGSSARFGGAKSFAEASRAPTRPKRAGRITTGLPYWPALDGLRAVAVVAVLLYHAGVTGLPGGLLGVDVFFVLSGFLITTLLLDERMRSGTVALRKFWSRRVRRLLPALLLVLVAVSASVSLVAGPGDLHSVRDDALSALFYVANWRFALSGQSYFDHFGAPSPLLHLWSLGVEEQFYLVWPLVVLLVTRRARRPARTLGFTAVVLAAASTVALVALHAAGASDSRLYYGTDTRALTLLVGAALACLLAAPRGRHRRRIAHRRSGRWLVSALGLAGAITLGLAFATVTGEDPLLYSGGFLVVAVATAAVLACIVLVPHSPLARLLGLAPLAAIGRISYGLYLWHWPLFLALDGRRTGLSGPALLGLRLGGALALSLASYFLVEKPIRQRRWRRPRMRFAVPAATLLTAGAVAIGTLPGVLPGTLPTAGAGGLDALNRVASQEASAASADLGAPAVPPHPKATEPVRVLVVGDSVALTVGAALRRVAPQWRTTVVNGGILGCGIGPGNRSRYSADLAYPSQRPCTDWPTWWRDATQRFHPDVVLLISGRWETFNSYVNGRRATIGQPDFDRLLSANFDKAINLFGSLHTQLAMVTTPCVARTELADGSLDPASDPARTARYNQLLRGAVARHPQSARVLDLGATLCPGGHYTDTLGGLPVRFDDGIHVGIAAGPVIAPLLLGGARTISGLPARPKD